MNDDIQRAYYLDAEQEIRAVAIEIAMMTQTDMICAFIKSGGKINSIMPTFEIADRIAEYIRTGERHPEGLIQ